MSTGLTIQQRADLLAQYTRHGPGRRDARRCAACNGAYPCFYRLTARDQLTGEHEGTVLEWAR